MPFSFREIVIILGLFIILNYTGWWPKVIRGIREWRGDVMPEDSTKVMSGSDLELSYKLLGLTPAASWEEVEKAYRSKAKVHHPDRGGDQDAMRALNDAYSTLKRVHTR